MSQITWRNVNQDTGIKDALSATTAAQNSFNGSLSALDKVLGQQQDIAQRGVDRGRLMKENAYLETLQTGARDPAELESMRNDGTLAEFWQALTPEQRSKHMNTENTMRTAAQGLMTGDRAYDQSTVQYDNRNDIAVSQRLGMSGLDPKEFEAQLGGRSEDAKRILRDAYTAGVTGRVTQQREAQIHQGRMNLNDATITQMGANTGLIGAQTQDTLAGVAGTAAQSEAAVHANKVQLAATNAAFNLQGNIYTPERGGAIRDKESRSTLIKEFTETYGDPENKMAVRARLLIGKAPDQVKVTLNGKEVVLPVPTAVVKNAIKDELTNNLRLRHNNAVDNVNNRIIRIMETTPEYLDAWDQYSYSQPTAMLKRK